MTKVQGFVVVVVVGDVEIQDTMACVWVTADLMRVYAVDVISTEFSSTLPLDIRAQSGFRCIATS